MKKLRLNNIFHWLYALLMFLPFILLVLNVLVMFGSFVPVDVNGDGTLIYDFSGGYINILLSDCIPFELFKWGALGNVHTAICDVFSFFIGFDGDFSVIDNSVYCLFVYWVEVSLLYLCFDVLMFVINLAHRWIDRGADL